MESILKYLNVKIIYGICLRNRQKKFKSDDNIVKKNKYEKEFKNFNKQEETLSSKNRHTRSKSCIQFDFDICVDWNSIPQNMICEYVSELFNECIEITDVRYKDVDSQEKTIFDIKKNIVIEQYLERIIKLTEIDHNSIITALVLIDKFLYRSGIHLRKSNICFIVLTAFYISIKMNEDKIFKSKFLSEIFGVSMKKLSELESYFLECIKFRCLIKPNVHKFYSGCISEYLVR